ncbi:MAG TPA: hypothetical protein VI248_11565 [Kineosporiaceae bacterium]
MSRMRLMAASAGGRGAAIAAMTALAITAGGVVAGATAAPPATGGKRHNLYVKTSPGVQSILFQVIQPGTTAVRFSRCYDTQGSDWQPTGFKVDNGATIVASTFDKPGCPSDPASLRGRSNARTAPERDGSADWMWDFTATF